MHFTACRTLAALYAFVATSNAAALGGHCPPLGPVLPAPRHPSTNDAVKSAVSALKEALDERTAAYNGSGLAIGLKSIHEDDYLLEYAHTPDHLDPRGVDKIDSDSVFRIASVSKLFPVLAILKLKGVSLDDAVTEYVPELKKLNDEAREQNAIWAVDWDDITIGSLASHMSGVAADLPIDIEPFGNWTVLGFPEPDPSRSLNCSGLFGTDPCDIDVFWDRFGERPPVYAPFSSNPVYANIGWTILGLVIENVSGVSSAEFIKENILDPTGMEHTFSEKPKDSLGFIPTDDVFWNVSLGLSGPAGGYYSSVNDLIAFGEAVLGHKLLSPAKTRKWLKPVTGTASQSTYIGEPWEITRAHNVTNDGRIVEFYAKGGDLITYHSSLILIPDYDLVLSILTAGPTSDQAGVSGVEVQVLFSNIVSTILPAIEQAGQDESEVIYAGTYADSKTNSSITFSVDDEPGLSITNWIVRGTDIIATYPSLGLPPTFPTPDILTRLRLYPTTLATKNQSSWRTVATLGTEEEIAALDSLVSWPEATCTSWGSMDRLVYQLYSGDHLVFTERVDENGKIATDVELVGYRVKLSKQSQKGQGLEYDLS